MAGAKGLFFYIFVVFCIIIFYLTLLLLLLREGRQNTPHECSLHMMDDCFFHIFVAVPVFVSYFDFVVVG